MASGQITALIVSRDIDTLEGSFMSRVFKTECLGAHLLSVSMHEQIAQGIVLDPTHGNFWRDKGPPQES